MEPEPNPNAQIDPPTVAAQTTPPEPTTTDTVDLEAKARKKQHDAQLTALGKTFGHIPDVPVFTEWATRLECSGAAVHRSAMAGICGSKVHGVYSVALSNLYHDDQDGGDVIFYTGVGGRERWSNAVPPKRLRVGPQTKDQTWLDRENQALQRSFETGNPVRVIRSSKCPSQYAPLNKGYRYDGLYKVAACWTAKGHNGKEICRCRLERLPDQPPIPLRPITISASGRKRGRFVSTPPWPSPQKGNNGGGEFEGSLNESDEKPTQQLTSQPTISPDSSTLPRYRFDPNTHELVRVRSDVLPGVETEEEHRAEDDATLVPSEDGHANEGMGTD